jgi:hypothetical protein
MFKRLDTRQYAALTLIIVGVAYALCTLQHADEASRGAVTTIIGLFMLLFAES